MKTKPSKSKQLKVINFVTLLTLFLTFYFSLFTFNSFSQGVAINTTGNAANAKAGLDIDFTNLGLLIPRLTTVQRDAITATIPESLLIFNTTTKCFEAFVNSAWNTVSCPAACTPPTAPTSNAASAIDCNSFTANWTASAGATAYLLDVATDAGFTSFVAGYNNLNVGNVTSSPVSGLTAGTPYYYRVRATTACVSGNSGTQNPTTLTAPAQPSVITGTTPVCQGNNGVAYSVTNVIGVTYTWSYSGAGYTQASGGTTNSITANFSAAATSGTLTVTPSNACGNGTARTYAIVVSATPTTAAAGSDINPACGVTTATLAGNNPGVGTGAWSVVSGTVTITNSTLYNSGVTGLAVPGTATLRWTISNAPCAPLTDDVVITTTACFVCGNSLTDVRDGKSYNTVLIGAQCWMAQNLDYGTYVAVVNGGQAGAGTQKYCQNLSGVNDNTCPFGGLYEWAEMMNGSTTCNGSGAPPNDKCATPVQGICPAGWHIPSHYEWTTLEKNVGSNPGAFPYDVSTTGWLGTNEGNNLKTTGNGSPPLWASPSAGTNTSNFSALPGGYSWSGSFGNVGGSGYWWSATEYDATNAWRRDLDFSFATVSRGYVSKMYGWSVRCVKD